MPQYMLTVVYDDTMRYHMYTDYAEAAEHLNVLSIINAEGEYSTVLINNHQTPIKVALSSNSDHSRIEKHTVTYTEKGINGENIISTDKKTILSYIYYI